MSPFALSRKMGSPMQWSKLLNFAITDIMSKKSCDREYAFSGELNEFGYKSPFLVEIGYFMHGRRSLGKRVAY